MFTKKINKKIEFKSSLLFSLLLLTKGKNRTNIIKKIQEGRGSYGRFNKGSHRGIELQNSIYNSGLWWDRSRRRRCRNMDHHDGTGITFDSFCAKPQSGESGKSSACFRICDRVGRELFQRHHRGRKQTLHTLVNDSCTVSCMCESDRTFWI